MSLSDMTRLTERDAQGVIATCSAANSTRHGLHELKQRVAQQKLQTFLALEALATQQYGDTNEQDMAVASVQTMNSTIDPLHLPPKAVPSPLRKKVPAAHGSGRPSPVSALAPVRCPTTLIPATEASPLTPTFRPLGQQKGRSRRTGPRPSVGPVTPTPFATNPASPTRKVRFSSVLNARSPSPAMSPQRASLAGSDSGHSGVPTDHTPKGAASTHSVTELVVHTTTAVTRGHTHANSDDAVEASDETISEAETLDATASSLAGSLSQDEADAPDALPLGHGHRLLQPISHKAPDKAPPQNAAHRAKTRHENMTIRHEMVQLHTQIEDLILALESKTLLCQALEAELASVRAENDALRAVENSPHPAANPAHAVPLKDRDSNTCSLQTSSAPNDGQRLVTFENATSSPDHTHFHAQHHGLLSSHWSTHQAKLVKVCDALGLDCHTTNRQETLHSNGKLEWYLPRHTTTVLAYPDGNVKVISAHPAKRTLIFANGDVQETFDQDHRLVYFYADANVRHTQNGHDQSELWEYLDDGYAEQWYADGRKELVPLLREANR